MENAIELRHVTKTFGRVTANRDVSLELKKGEILSLLGENGSGKTTLMNMIAGIYYPDEGEIFVTDAGWRSVPQRRLQSGIAMIHQHFNWWTCLRLWKISLRDWTKRKNMTWRLSGRGPGRSVKNIALIWILNQKVYEMSVSRNRRWRSLRLCSGELIF